MRILIMIVALPVLICLATQAKGQTIDKVLLQTLQADVAQKAGMTGKGITIGVISSGPVGYQDAEASGDLPTIEFPPGYNPAEVTGWSEGTAMMELVHQIAPDANIAFCGLQSSNLNLTSIGGCATALYAAFHTVIIVDDSGTSFAYDAPDSDTYLIDTLIQSHPELIYLHAAGNYEGTENAAAFTPTNMTIAGKQYQVQDFGAAVGQPSNQYEAIVVESGKTIQASIEWNDNPSQLSAQWPDSSTLGIWLISASGAVLEHAEASHPISVAYTNNSTQSETINVVVGLIQCNNPAGCNADTMSINMTSNITPLPIPSVAEQPGQALGASTNIWVIGALKSPAAGIGEGGAMESLSAEGPYYNYWSATPDPLIPYSNGYQVLDYTRLPAVQIIHHPDFVGVDDDLITPIPTFNNDFGVFSGTSAAAPTVAAAVALLLSAGYTKDQIRAALEQTSLPVPAYGDTTTSQFKDTWAPADGYGLVQVWAAAKYLGYAVPTPTITAPSGTYVDIHPGDSVTFAGSCADGDTAIQSYAWDMGDGTASTDENPGAHTYAKDGNYTVTFNCTDANGHASPTPATFAVVVMTPASTSTGGSSGGGGGALSLLTLSLLGLLGLLGRAQAGRH